MTRSREFVGASLKLARCAAGLTQGELGELVGAASSTISHIENDRLLPNDLLVGALAEVLGFERGFFYRGQLPQFDVQEINFRHRAKTPGKVKARVAAKATLFLYVVRYLDDLLKFPAFDVPQILANSPGEIESASESTRMHWSLGLGPIKNLIRVVEHAGIVVTRFEEADDIDAFSAYKEGLAVIFLNTSRVSTSRARWNVAHEIGHLVLHRSQVTGSRELEHQADRFAAAFLMPAEKFAQEFRLLSKTDWPYLFELKRRWKVSVGSIIRRAYDLELIGAAQYRRLYKSLSARGWRQQEPQEPPVEEPELLDIALDSLMRNRGETALEIAGELDYLRENMARVIGRSVGPPMPDNVASLEAHRRLKQAAG